MKKIWKLCAFLPALFMMGVIFSFSAQTGTQSGSLSHDISPGGRDERKVLSSGT